VNDALIRKVPSARLLGYRPLPAAEIYHASPKRYRWFFGGNRSGKSEASTGFDLCSYALDLHPTRRLRKGATMWAVAPTWDMVGAIVWKEKVKSYLPANQIKGLAWHNKARDIPAVLHLANGATIEFKAFEQGRVAFQGRDIAGIYADEQCAHDSEAIWQEMQMRLLDSDGFLAWSCTPLIAQPWLEARAADPGPDDEVVYADLNDNRLSRGGYIADDRIASLIAEWPEEVQETRIRGHFAAFMGTVYKTFRRDVHVRDVDLPDDAERFPCLQTGTPAPATTSEAIVDTLTECDPSPPVPTTSTHRSRSASVRGTNVAACIAASSRPCSSTAVSPLARSATTNPAIWAAVASPTRIDDMAAAAWLWSRSRPASSCPSSSDQSWTPCWVDIDWIVGRTRAEVVSGHAAALADDAATITLGGPTPHAGLLPERQRVLQAGRLHVTAGAHRLGHLGPLVVFGIEQRRVEASTSSEIPPLQLLD